MAHSISAQFSSQQQRLSLKDLISWIKSLKIRPQLKLLLRSLADYYGNDGRCWPSIRRLADEICVCRATIHRWLNQLEGLGIISRKARFRTNGGKTSNIYKFMLHGDVTPVLYEEKDISKCKHAAKQDAGYKSNKSKNNTTTRYKINPESMQNITVANKHYQTAVKHQWITTSTQDQTNYFASWAKCVRQWRDGETKNPAAMLVHIIKSGLLNKFPTDKDIKKAKYVLNRLATDGMLTTTTT